MNLVRIITEHILAAAVLALAWPSLAAEPSLPQPAFEISSVRSDLNRPARDYRSSYAEDVIDVLAHVTPPSVRRGRQTQTDHDVIARVADAGVTLAYLMPTPNEGGNERHADGTAEKITLARQSRGRIGVFCGGDYMTTWLYDAQINGYKESDWQARLRRLEADLDGGVCAGIGELGLLHFNKTGDQPEIRLRPTFPPFLDVIALAARKGVRIDVHAEPMEPDGTSHEAETFGALSLWLARHPDLKLMLSHTAMTNPTNARRLLGTYPTLMLAVKLVKAPANHWRNLEPVLDRRGRLYEDWAVFSSAATPSSPAASTRAAIATTKRSTYSAAFWDHSRPRRPPRSRMRTHEGCYRGRW